MGRCCRARHAQRTNSPVPLPLAKIASLIREELSGGGAYISYSSGHRGPDLHDVHDVPGVEKAARGMPDAGTSPEARAAPWRREASRALRSARRRGPAPRDAPFHVHMARSFCGRHRPPLRRPLIHPSRPFTCVWSSSAAASRRLRRIHCRSGKSTAQRFSPAVRTRVSRACAE